MQFDPLYRSSNCPECRKEVDESCMRKVFLIYTDLDCPVVPIPDEVLMKTNTNLLDQLSEKSTEIEQLTQEYAFLQFQAHQIQKDCDSKRDKIRSMERTATERNKKIHSKEQIIRTLQAELKNLKLENNALKKKEVSTQSKEQKVEDKLIGLQAENQRLQRLLNTKPNHNAKASSSEKNKN